MRNWVKKIGRIVSHYPPPLLHFPLMIGQFRVEKLKSVEPYILRNRVKYAGLNR